ARARDSSYGSVPLNTLKKPCLCSNAPGLAVNPLRASSAACNPPRAHWPACRGLVMVPKLDLVPADSDVAIASAVSVCPAVSPSNLAQAAAVANTPRVAVGCHPLWECWGLTQRPMAAPTS